jgi:hypothetical protein
MKNIFILFFLISNISFAQDKRFTATEIFDVKGISMDMPYEEVEKIILKDGLACEKTVININNKRHERFYPNGDIALQCETFKVYGRKTGVISAYFINSKLNALFINIGYANSSDNSKNPFPDFFKTFTLKYKIEAAYSKMDLSAGDFSFETNTILDAEGSFIDVSGEKREYVDGVVFRGVKFYFFKNQYYTLVAERQRLLEKNKAENAKFELNKQKSDL